MGVKGLLASGYSALGYGVMRGGLVRAYMSIIKMEIRTSERTRCMARVAIMC